MNFRRKNAAIGSTNFAMKTGLRGSLRIVTSVVSGIGVMVTTHA